MMSLGSEHLSDFIGVRGDEGPSKLLVIVLYVSPLRSAEEAAVLILEQPLFVLFRLTAT
jgi:hypothetical protein